MLKKITLAVTGASGMPYAITLLKQLLSAKIAVNFVISKAGIITMHEEMDIALALNPNLIQEKMLESLGDDNTLEATKLFKVYGIEDWYAPIASGSNVDDAMIICPCSMATLAKVAHGFSDDLIARSADVILKEQKQLIIVPREMPFSVIHLENMLKLSKMGVAIIPPIPAFYTKPQTIADMVNFVVSRILDQVGIVNSLSERW